MAGAPGGTHTQEMFNGERLFSEASMINRVRRDASPYCSFCGKAPEQVGLLVAGPRVFICDGCIGLCLVYLPLRSRLSALATMFSPWKPRFRSIKSWADMVRP